MLFQIKKREIKLEKKYNIILIYKMQQPTIVSGVSGFTLMGGKKKRKSGKKKMGKRKTVKRKTGKRKTGKRKTGKKKH